MKAREMFAKFFEMEQCEVDLSVTSRLKISFDAFTKLRYPYEGLLDTGWMALDVVYATRNHILGEFPDWERAGISGIVNRE